MSYSRIGLLAIIILVIINANTMFGKTESAKVRVRNKYRYFLYAVMIFLATDITWGVLTELTNVPLSYINSFAAFFSMGLTAFLWIRYIREFLNQKNIWSNVLGYSAWVLFVTEIVILIVNLFVPIMYYFKPDGEYVTLLPRQIIMDVQIGLYTIIGLYTLIRAGKHTDRDRSHHLAVGLSGLFMAFCIFLQAKYPMTPFYSMGLVIATCIMHSFVQIDERIESSRKIGSYMRVAYKDPLTQVRNATAYKESKNIIDNQLKNGAITNLGVIVFDVNNLKTVNDTLGHEAGDRYIQDACSLICHVFTHSPVFRIGGDEFAAFLLNDDYTNREELFAKFNKTVESHLDGSGPVVAAGMSVFAPGEDEGYDVVFERADNLMYERKKELKRSGQASED